MHTFRQCMYSMYARCTVRVRNVATVHMNEAIESYLAVQSKVSIQACTLQCDLGEKRTAFDENERRNKIAEGIDPEMFLFFKIHPRNTETCMVT